MYAFPDMIDMGLHEGQVWPSEAHMKVAQVLAIGNGLVDSRDKMTEVVQAVIAIPEDRIKLADTIECATVHKVPYIQIS